MTLMTQPPSHVLPIKSHLVITNAPYFFLAKGKNGQVNIFIAIPLKGSQKMADTVHIDGAAVVLAGVSTINLPVEKKRHAVVEIPLMSSFGSDKISFEYLRFVLPKHENLELLEIKVKDENGKVRTARVRLAEVEDVFDLPSHHFNVHVTNVPYIYLMQDKATNHFFPKVLIVPNGIKYEERFEVIEKDKGDLACHIVLYKENTHPTKTVIMPDNTNNVFFEDTSTGNGAFSTVVEVKENVKAAENASKEGDKGKDDAAKKNATDPPEKPTVKVKTKDSDAM